MRSSVRRALVMDQSIKKFRVYFHYVRPENLEMVINRIISDSPDVQAKISASAAVDDEARRVVYFVIEVACEETINYETKDLFNRLQDLLKREKLIGQTYYC